MALDPPVRMVVPAAARLGEGPVWDAGRGVLWFVDIKQHRLWSYDPVQGTQAYVEAPGPIGWALPAEHDLLLCGLKDGLYLHDPVTRGFDRLMAVPGEPVENRLNDGCTDRWGRVWFGSMDDAEGRATGRFHVFDRGEVRAAGPAGIAITNGPAVNAAGDRIYFTDTLGKRILVADLTPDGVGTVRPLIDTASAFPDAYPDGPVVDAEDHLWTGLYRGGHVARYSPDGRLVDRVRIPARDVTKLAFGGAGLSTAYVSTATKDMTDDDMRVHPDAGSVFAFDAPVAGCPVTRVKLG